MYKTIKITSFEEIKASIKKQDLLKNSKILSFKSKKDIDFKLKLYFLKWANTYRVELRNQENDKIQIYKYTEWKTKEKIVKRIWTMIKEIWGIKKEKEFQQLQIFT